MAESIKLRDPLAPLTQEERAFLFTNPAESMVRGYDYSRPSWKDAFFVIDPGFVSDQQQVMSGKIVLSRQLLSGTFRDTPIPEIILAKDAVLTEQSKRARAEFDEWLKENIPNYSPEQDHELQEFKLKDRGIFNPYTDNPVYDVLAAEERSFMSVDRREVFAMTLQHAGVSHPDGPLSFAEQTYIHDLLVEDVNLVSSSGMVKLPIFPQPVVEHTVPGQSFPFHLAPQEYWQQSH